MCIRDRYWALTHGCDYVFNCFCDTYVDIEKLMHSGFEEHDFIGMTYDTNRCPQGGGGYWLSKKCLEILVSAHVDFWADDGWAGFTLPKHGVLLHNDLRYGQYPDGVPTPQNDIITTHLGQHPYKTMRDIHAGTWNGHTKGKVYVEWYEEGQVQA